MKGRDTNNVRAVQHFDAHIIKLEREERKTTKKKERKKLKDFCFTHGAHATNQATLMAVLVTRQTLSRMQNCFWTVTSFYYGRNESGGGGRDNLSLETKRYHLITSTFPCVLIQPHFSDQSIAARGCIYQQGIRSNKFNQNN